MADTQPIFNPQKSYCSSKMLVDNESLCNLFPKKDGYIVIDTRHCTNSLCDFIVYQAGKRDVAIFVASTTEHPLEAYKNTLSELECNGIIVFSVASRQTLGLEVITPGYILVSMYTDDLNGISDMVRALNQIDELMKPSSKFR